MMVLSIYIAGIVVTALILLRWLAAGMVRLTDRDDNIVPLRSKEGAIQFTQAVVLWPGMWISLGLFIVVHKWIKQGKDKELNQS